MRSGTKKRMELEERMRKVLFSTMIPMACLMIILLFIFWQYTGQYNKLSENLAVSSEFNLRFKDDLDLEMYYIAIGSKESSDLEDVLEQVEDAQEIIQKLRRNTYNNNGVKSLNSLDSYLENLRQRMLQLVEIKEYDKRMEFMDSNIRIITGLIMQEMQNYIYNESMYLVQVEKSLTHRVKLLISGMAVLLIATLGILMRRSFRLTDGIIHPVNIMLDKVKKVGRGKFDMIPIEAEIEEIEELDEGINKMARKISALLENVRQEKEMQHLTELQLIQAQVNPHFLYNTLDSIVWMITGERYDDAVFMITQLASLFRISLSRGKTIIRVEDEIKHAENYMNIQKIRYKNAFEISFDIAPEILSACTVKLVVQPILENAIYYGMEAMDDDGVISVRGYQKDGDVFLEISDNGLGMPEEAAAKLLTEGERVRSRGSGVGLLNVHNRIRLRFGEQYGLQIESFPDEGMTVRIHIPYIPYTEETCRQLEEGKLPDGKGGRSV